VAAAVRAVAHARCDLVVLVRGGGSKGDLAALDAEPVARAVATAHVPVWTGIGHTGDQSVADIVANRAFVTPTECGQAVVQKVGQWWEAFEMRASQVARRAAEALASADRHGHQGRARLVACTRNQLHRHSERLDSRAQRLVVQAPHGVSGAMTALTARVARIGPLARSELQNQSDRVLAWRRLLAAYDVTRQLERGYTLTLDEEGRIVREAGRIRPGAALLTKFADGTVRSAVQQVELTDVSPVADRKGEHDEPTEKG
jgi:exodeoxyribonuclease VII large subunit